MEAPISDNRGCRGPVCPAIVVAPLAAVAVRRSKGNDHILDAVRCAMLAREEGNLDQAGEETVSLKPVLAEPVFI